MYSLFRDSPNRRLGQALDPNIVYLRRTYKDLIRYVKQYYYKNPKYVGSPNLLADIIQHFYIDDSLDDNAFSASVQQQAVAVARNFGLFSSMFKGRVFDKGITLGPQCNEIAIASFERPNYRDLKHWRDLEPVKYLYHTRTDVNLPVMNNTTPGKGYGVITINIPMLLVQYRYWLRSQKAKGVEQYENPYRFIGSIVLTNMLTSYLDIAYFNRLSRAAQGIKSPKYTTAHPFYLTDLTDRVDRLIVSVNYEATLKGIEPEGLAWITPAIVKDNLFQVMALPREPLSYQNEWVYTLARFPYVKYLLLMLSKNPGFDRAQVNEIMIELINASNDSIFKSMGSTDFIKQFNWETQELIKVIGDM